MPANIVVTACQAGFIILSIALVVALFRAFKGPRAADRIVALDLLAGITLAIVTLLAISSGKSVYLNVAVCLSLLAFMSTAAFARYLSRRQEQAKH